MSDETQARSISKFAVGVRYGVIIVGLLFSAGAAVQVFVAGLSIFDSALYWDDHILLGRMLGLLALLLPVLTLVGRLGRRIILLSTLVTTLYIVQTFLANIGIGTLAAFHAVNAFPLVGISFGVGMRTLGIVRTPEAELGSVSGDG